MDFIALQHSRVMLFGAVRLPVLENVLSLRQQKQEGCMTENNPSRRNAMQQLAAGVSLAAMNAPTAQAQGASIAGASTAEDFVRLQKQLSNWNRWGANDQMG